MRVSLYITCYNDSLFPETGKAVVRVLERVGAEVEFRPEQTCCGQMHANTGFRREAFALAARFVRQYADAEAVCIPSSSCVAMIREQYPGLIAESGSMSLRAEFAALLPRVHEFTEYLMNVAGVEDVGAYFPHRVTYHASCHGLRSLHAGDRPMRLLSRVRGIELAPLRNLDRCCGFGGTFSIKNAEVSSEMLAEKLGAVRETKASFVTALDNSCLMHIGGALHRGQDGVSTLHIAEILAGRGDAR